MMRAKIVAVAALVASCGSSDAEKWANFTVKVVQSNIKTTFDGQFLELTIEPSSPAVVAVVPPAPLRWAGRKPGELDKFYLDKGTFEVDDLPAGRHTLVFEGIVVEDSTTLKPRPNVPPVKLTVEVEKKPSPVTFGPYMGADLACDSKDPKISCKVTLSDDATAALSAMNGAVFELRGKTITIKDHAIEKVPFTQLDPFYAATLEAVFEGKAAPVVKEKVAVGLPGGQRLEGEIEVGFLKARALIAGKLVEAASSGKPFLFPGEAQGAAGQARHAVAVVNGYKLFGKRDAKVSELDLVGFLTDGPKRSQSCGNYTNKSTGEVKEIFYELRDKKVTLVDRRTGQVFRETLIKTPSQTCAKKEASAGFKYTAEPPPATIVAWIEAQLR